MSQQEAAAQASGVDHPSPQSKFDRLKVGARQAVVAVKPNFNEAQKRALDAGTNAVIGTLANVTIAAAAGLIGGRIHPRAPEVLYAVMSVGIGVGVVEKNPAIGTMLASGGMVAMAGMAMRAVASAITGSQDVSTDPFELAGRVGRAVGEAPTSAPPQSATEPLLPPTGSPPSTFMV